MESGTVWSEMTGTVWSEMGGTVWSVIASLGTANSYGYFLLSTSLQNIPRMWFFDYQ